MRITIIISCLCFSINVLCQTLTTNFGHYGSCVVDVKLSHDKKMFVTAGLDRKVMLWDTQTFSEIRTFIGHEQIVTAVDITKDRNTIASASGSKTKEGRIILWDSKTGEQKYNLKAHDLGVTRLQFFNNDSFLISASYDGTVKIWETKTGNQIQYLPFHDKRVFALAVNPECNQVFSGGSDGVGKLWDLFSKKIIFEFDSDTTTLLSADFSSDNRYLAVGRTNKITIYTLNDFKIATEIPFSSKDVYDVFFCVDNKRLISSSNTCQSSSGLIPFDEPETNANNDITVWDLNSSTPLFTLNGNECGIISIDLSSDNTKVISASLDRSIGLWNLEERKREKTFKRGFGDVKAISLSNDNGYLAVADNSLYGKKRVNNIKIFDLKNGRLHSLLSGHKSTVLDIDFSNNDRYLASCSYDGKVKLWNVNSGKNVEEFKYGNYYQFTVSFNPQKDGKLMSYGGHPIIWSLANGRGKKIAKKYQWDCYCSWCNFGAKYSKTGKYAAMYCFSSLFIMDSKRYRKKIFTYPHKKCYIKGFAFSNNDSLVATIGCDIKLHDINTGKEIYTIDKGFENVTAIEFSIKDTLLISGHRNGDIILWDEETGTLKDKIQVHTSHIKSIAVSNNGRFLFTDGHDGTVCLTDIKLREKLATIFLMEKSEDYLILTPDGRYDGTTEAIKNLYYMDGFKRKSIDINSDRSYVKGLLAKLFKVQ